jgi:hypothetical protein
MIPTKENLSIQDRLYTLLKSVLNDGVLIPSMYHPVIMNLVKGFLKRTSPDDLRKQILFLRDNVIPWVLGENEDKN